MSIATINNYYVLANIFFDWLAGPGKTTYMFSVTLRFPLRLFNVLPAGGGGWVRQGGGGSGNGKYVGVSGKRIC